MLKWIAFAQVLALVAAIPGIGAVERSSAGEQCTTYRCSPAHSGIYPGPAGKFFSGIQWRLQTGGAVRSSPLVSGDTVYVGSSDQHLYAIDEITGTARWSFSAASAVTSSPAVDAKSVFFVSQDGIVYAVDRVHGTQRWAFHTRLPMPLPWGHESGDYWTASPTLDGNRVYVGGRDGYLYSLNAANGRKLWSTKTGGRITSAPALDNGRLYIGAADGKLYALDASNGKIIWTFASEGATLHSADYGYDRRTIVSSPVVAQGVVLFGAKDGSFYAVDARFGHELWHHSAGVFWYLSSPAVHDRMAFTGNSDGRFVQALDVKDGHVVWQFDAGINVFASPSVADGVVYCAGWDGRLHAIDEHSGKELWSFMTGGRRIFSSVTIDHSRVFFGADDGGVYALNLSSLPLHKAVFYDASLNDRSTVQHAKEVQTFLSERGYRLVDAAALPSFLSADAEAARHSVIVFSMDALPPAAVADRNTPMLRSYLDHGGTVVWIGAPPLLWGDKPLQQRTLMDLNRLRPQQLIGVTFSRGNFDPMTAFVTSEGARRGLSGSWLSNWAADPESVTTVLARDEQGLAAAWDRRFGGPVGTGFVAIPLVVSPQGIPLNVFAIDMAAQYRMQQL